jgi:rhodanese-related sulfurtransferase
MIPVMHEGILYTKSEVHTTMTRRGREISRRSCLTGGLILLLLLAVSGCTTPTSPDGGDIIPILQTIPADEAMILIGDKPDLTIIDVRTAGEFQSGHLRGAVNMDISRDFSGTVSGLNRDEPYLIYCAVGGRGASALRMMGDLGFTEVYNLGGGISAWQRAGGAIEG